jgi:NTP pyrophosphatase (non-canonical NTP hydrolase)
MSDVSQSWLLAFAAAAEKTDSFASTPDHVALLSAGLIGEAGSVVAEFKKARREREAYPAYKHRMLEEVGDFLWYYVRLVGAVAPSLVQELPADPDGGEPITAAHQLSQFLRFGASVGDCARAVADRGVPRETLRLRLRDVWDVLLEVCREVGSSLEEAAARNTQKTADRWPTERIYCPLFDDDYPEEEQLPRRLDIEFKERRRGAHKAVVLRCNGINFGDRLTDNIQDPDEYRYHDIFHFAYAVHLGWSPIIRGLLRSKRKSVPEVDEAQDGARAGIIEEAVAAIVFSRAKQLKFFEGLDHLDFDLLKTAKEFVGGFEVERVPMWQWEQAILDGYRVFRLLRAGPGGRVTLDLNGRQLVYALPPSS